MERNLIEETDDSIIYKLTGTHKGTQYSVYFNIVSNKWTGEWFNKLEDAKQWLINLRNLRTQKSQTGGQCVTRLTRIWKNRK